MLDSKATYHRGNTSWLLFIFVLLCFSVNSLHAQVTSESTATTETSGLSETPQEDAGEFPFRPVRTDSPRQTLRTFLRLRDDLELTLQDYRDEKT